MRAFVCVSGFSVPFALLFTVAMLLLFDFRNNNKVNLKSYITSIICIILNKQNTVNVLCSVVCTVYYALHSVYSAHTVHAFAVQSSRTAVIDM